jgi:hypothetical protein
MTLMSTYLLRAGDWKTAGRMNTETQSQENKLHPGAWKSKKRLTNFSQGQQRYRFGARPVSDFVSKRAADRGLHQTLIEAQWLAEMDDTLSASDQPGGTSLSAS